VLDRLADDIATAVDLLDNLIAAASLCDAASCKPRAVSTSLTSAAL
jgi:hypothetical protein